MTIEPEAIVAACCSGIAGQMRGKGFPARDLESRRHFGAAYYPARGDEALLRIRPFPEMPGGLGPTLPHAYLMHKRGEIDMTQGASIDEPRERYARAYDMADASVDHTSVLGPGRSRPDGACATRLRSRPSSSSVTMRATRSRLPSEGWASRAMISTGTSGSTSASCRWRSSFQT